MKPVAEQNLYELLEVPFDASESVIVEAWYRAERLHGPGAAATTPDPGCEAALWCTRLEEAIEVLLDPLERGRYDARLLARTAPERLAAAPEPGHPLAPAVTASAPEGPASTTEEAAGSRDDAANVSCGGDPGVVLASLQRAAAEPPGAAGVADVREIADVARAASAENTAAAESADSADLAESAGSDDVAESGEIERAEGDAPGRCGAPAGAVERAITIAAEPTPLEPRRAARPPPLPRRGLSRSAQPLALAEAMAPPDEVVALSRAPLAAAELPEVEADEVASAPVPEDPVAPILLAIPLTAFAPKGAPAGEVASGEPAEVTPLFGDESDPAEDLAPEVEAVEPPAAPPPRPVRPARRTSAPAGGLLLPEGTVFTGEVIRLAREARGLTLGQLSERTKVMRHHLENLEADRFERLPAPVYLRGILVAVAKELRLDGPKVARSYLERLSRPPPATAKGG